MSKGRPVNIGGRVWTASRRELLEIEGKISVHDRRAEKLRGFLELTDELYEGMEQVPDRQLAKGDGNDLEHAAAGFQQEGQAPPGAAREDGDTPQRAETEPGASGDVAPADAGPPLPALKAVPRDSQTEGYMKIIRSEGPE